MISNRSARKGFTLIELLVVIAIIAILAAILFPVFAKAREKARQTSCASNMKQIALGFTQYVQDFDEQWPSGNTNTSGAGGTGVINGAGWASQIFNEIKSNGVFKCPDDSTATVGPNAGTNNNTWVPLSYGMNSNLVGTALAQLNAPASTISGFEVSGVTGAPSLANDPAGASGNGTQGAAVAAPGTAAAPGVLSTGTHAGATEAPLYETGYTNGTSGTPAGYDTSFNGGGLHSGAANYMFADSHVKWLNPSAVYVGANNTSTASAGTGVSPDICGWGAGTASPGTVAANTGCSNHMGGTFSIN